MDFYKKNIHDKRAYLVLMLEQLRQAHGVFDQLYRVLDQDGNHEESLYDELYDTIKTLGHDLKTLSQKQQASLLSKTQQILQKIRDDEEKDRLKEQEGLDDLLDGI